MESSKSLRLVIVPQIHAASGNPVRYGGAARYIPAAMPRSLLGHGAARRVNVRSGTHHGIDR